MTKKVIRLTEEDLHNIVKESVKRYLNEISDLTIHSAMNQANKQAHSAKTPLERSIKTKQADRFATAYRDRLEKNHDMNIKRSGYNGNESTPYEINDYMDSVSSHPEFHSPKTLKGAKRYNDFNNNKYKYEKGKGWKPNMNQE